MKRYLFFIVLFLGFSLGEAKANNIRIDSLSWRASDVSVTNTKLTMRFLVRWENSWRDDYNYDAAYVFFKFKRKEKGTESSEVWNHLFLAASGHRFTGDNAGEYDYWLSPLSSPNTDFNTGVYVYRKDKGFYPKDSVWMEVTWNIVSQQITPQLTVENINRGDVLISGHALEMVYVPRGAYRIGDGVSTQGFRKLFSPILAENDIVNNRYRITASDATDGYPAADRVNDNTTGVASAWVGKTGATTWWWSIDFGEGVKKRVTYFGVNGSKTAPNNYPTYFKLEGSADPTASDPNWQLLWRGEGKRYWNVRGDAYPVENAIPIPPDKVGAYRGYLLTVEGMNTGAPVVTSIGMTEQDLASVVDYSILVDSPVTEIDSLKHLGASDGGNWGSGRVEKTFPNGYRGFYAMKYELSQDQYTRFLNKLTYRQQNAILEDRLDDLQEGDYIFGAPDVPDFRNGIMLLTKIEGMPAVFGCRLNGRDREESGGGDIACNYMNVRDMLAYADWAGLRPLSEMEYEKMCRSYYPAVPEKGSYAWGTKKLDPPSAEILRSGYPDEKVASGNANWGNVCGGPLRVGSFGSRPDPSLENGGGSFWGCMDLSGNLAEMYYNVNGRGLTLVEESGSGTSLTGHNTSHGNGMIGVEGEYDGAQRADLWNKDPNNIALRGGSFADEAPLLRTSDRTWFRNGVKSYTERNNTVTFRLGRTAPEYDELASWLIMENERTSQSADASDFMTASVYMIKGNKPVSPQGGICHYIWYSSENGGEWKVIEGETGQSLYFNKYAEDTIARKLSQNYSFKRKVFTPFADSETSTGRMGVIFNTLFDPFASQPVEIFTYSGNTHAVECSWDPAIPREWGLEGNGNGITIDPKTGVLSGLDGTMCNVTVTLKCSWNPEVIYKKQVKETYRNFAFTGGIQSLNLTSGTYKLECWGAQGGISGHYATATNTGGYARGNKTFSAPTKVYVCVGGKGVNGTSGTTTPAGGYNGGGNGGRGNSDNAAGGGATHMAVRTGLLKDLASYKGDVLIVAGGGGGNGCNTVGGMGGGSVGKDGSSGSYPPSGKGGTQTAGGSGYQVSGSFGKGADGASASSWGSGGGGGGWYGGGAGASLSGGASAGGGGSGYVGGVTGGSMTTGGRTGNGYARITVL